MLAFDPSLADARLRPASFNEITVAIPWEELEPGPGRRVYRGRRRRPSERRLLLPGRPERPHASRAGRAPAIGSQSSVSSADGLRGRDDHDPQFREGPWSTALWAYRSAEAARTRPSSSCSGCAFIHTRFARRMPIYSPAEKALLFGYFPASSNDLSVILPGGIVFTCLSHDIIAHETTHALFDGMHRALSRQSTRMSLAFHEAFADIVALFQHFTFPEVLRDQIRALAATSRRRTCSAS